MKRTVLILMALIVPMAILEAKTLIAYYSFTNNTRTIALELQSQLQNADLVEIEPAEEGLDYAANNYAIGSALISAIRNNPNDASSYPTIKDLQLDFSQYDEIVVATPLWWSNMAAPMQTFLFQNGAKMAGKRIGLIVSSSSSGISGVESDAHRLIPNGVFLAPSLWIRSSQTANCPSLISSWIESTGVGSDNSGVAKIDGGNHVTISLIGKQLQINGEFESANLYDAFGRKILSSSANTIDLSVLTPNTYIVMLRKGQLIESHKICVK